ncbi:hypothetical protein C5B35_01540 [Neisseria gonorrhoeae]|uniref:hypothetical protein n=1 Tax=Neisseria gonorrhoeae TaxID=485 RepID=UPI000CF0C11A|nr:hypothetical protein [Neisseria gonorrhoeae]PPZ67454.1 hypothetical protein C5B35_01540 [Neisseria gonorrhoeae]
MHKFDKNPCMDFKGELCSERNATQRNATQRNATQRNATQRNATQRNATQRNAMQRNATQRNAILRNPTISIQMPFSVWLSSNLSQKNTSTQDLPTHRILSSSYSI